MKAPVLILVSSLFYVHSIEAVRRGDLLTEGNYIAVPTLAEIIQKAGHRTVVAGTKSVAILQDRSARRTSPAAAASVMLYKGRSIPSSVLESIIKANDDK